MLIGSGLAGRCSCEHAGNVGPLIKCYIQTELVRYQNGGRFPSLLPEQLPGLPSSFHPARGFQPR